MTAHSRICTGHINGLVADIAFPAYVGSSSPILVFIHGMCGTSKVFAGWMDHAVSMGYPAVAVTLPVTPETSFETYCCHVEAAVLNINRRFPESPIILVGHSMGGLIAQAVASRRLVRIAGVVLVASAPPKGIRCFKPFWLKPRYAMAAIAGRTFIFSKGDADRHILNEMTSREADQAYAALKPESGRVLREVGITGVEVGTIPCPVLVVAGMQDALVAYGVHEKIAHRYGARIVRFSGGHMAPLEDADGRLLVRIVTWVSAYVAKRS